MIIAAVVVALLLFVAGFFDVGPFRSVCGAILRKALRLRGPFGGGE